MTDDYAELVARLQAIHPSTAGSDLNVVWINEIHKAAAEAALVIQNLAAEVERQKSLRLHDRENLYALDEKCGLLIHEKAMLEEKVRELEFALGRANAVIGELGAEVRWNQIKSR